MSTLRPLPPRPNLEFEHKEAKALLRRLRASDPESIARARARHPELDVAQVKLADAQLVIARDYGFTSWPKLVRWFGEANRWTYVATVNTREGNEGRVRTLIAEHRDKRTWTAHVLAATVPRFYGLQHSAVFDAAVTEDEAKLAIARMQGSPSWVVMLEEAAEHRVRHPHADTKEQPADDVARRRRPYEAMERADLDALKRAVELEPTLLTPTRWEGKRGHPLMRGALQCERTLGVEAMRPIIEWLGTQGIDPQTELNRMLCSHIHMEPESVQWLLDRGADPNWVAPNGLSVLEHLLLGRHRDSKDVDLIAARVKPRDALWVAAGLGDVTGVARFLDRDGKPTAAARKSRPDFMAVGPGGMPSHPDPDDETILFEAFLVALLNGRTAVMEYMVQRGFPVNTLLFGAPLIVLAATEGRVEIVECLLRCGADVELRGWRPNQNAREAAQEQLTYAPQNASYMRISELIGL